MQKIPSHQQTVHPPKRPGHLCRLAAYWLQPLRVERFGAQRRQRRHGGFPCDQGGEGSNFGIEILPPVVWGQ